jgi:hypothetical protein
MILYFYTNEEVFILKIKNFLIGICVSIVIEVCAIILGEMLIEGFSKGFVVNLIINALIILYMGAMIGIGLTLSEKNKNMKLDEKKKSMKSSMTFIICLIIIFIGVLIVSLIKSFSFGILLSTGFICPLLLWLAGAIFGYNSLKNKTVKEESNKTEEIEK